MSTAVTTRALTSSQLFWQQQGQRFAKDPKGYLTQQWVEFCAHPPRFIVHRVDLALQLNRDNALSVGAQINTFFSSLAPTIAEITSGNCFPAERTYQIAQVGLTGSAGIGGVAAITALIAGLPAVSTVMTILAIGNGVGAGMAGEAATKQSLADTLEKMRHQAMEASLQNATLRTHITSLTGQVNAFRTENASLKRTAQELTAQIDSLRTHITSLTRQVETFRAENAHLRTNIEDLTAQNATLKGNIENMASHIGTLAVQNDSLAGLVAQFQSQLTLFRTGMDQDRQRLLATLEQFTEQLTASQELWRRISQEAGAFREHYTAQLAQLSPLIAPLTNPRNTLAQLAVLKQTRTTLARHQEQLAALDAQIAQREGQLQARDELLTALRDAHTAILARLGQHDVSLEAEVTRLSALLQRILPTTAEVIVQRDMSPGHTLGIRCAPQWQDTVPFASTPTGWKGRIPLGQEFKFVMTSPNGQVQWEKGNNHFVQDPAGASSFTIII